MITEKRFAVINGIDSIHSIIRIMVMLCVIFASPFSTPLRAQHAGEVVKEASIRKKGEKHFFYVTPIPDSIFSMMKGKSYKHYCTTPRRELR